MSSSRRPSREADHGQHRTVGSPQTHGAEWSSKGNSRLQMIAEYVRSSNRSPYEPVWFSVSKTLVSTAVAILEDRGQIDVDKPIDSYLETLSGTAWEGIRVIDILDMTSGIDCPEVHEDADSCFWGFYDAFGWPMAARVQEDPMEMVKKMGKLRPAGQVFDYTSVNTEVLNWLVEAISGERFTDFIQREIWQRTGAESDALITTTPNGDAFSAGGVSTNLRDLARYGMLFTRAGRRGSAPVGCLRGQDSKRGTTPTDHRGRSASATGTTGRRFLSSQLLPMGCRHL